MIELFLGTVVSLILCVVAYALTIKMDEEKKTRLIQQGYGEMDAEKHSKTGFLEPWIQKIVYGISGTIFTVSLLSGAFFMQEPRENTFVRDITGHTYSYFNTGWHYKGFGTVVHIKKEMSASFGGSKQVSFPMPAKNAVFLDQVTSSVHATVRIVMPSNPKQFVEFIDKFGSPENAMRTMMIPSIERTIDATTALMTAEKYFSGGKNEFMNEFDKQMRYGLYVVDLKDVNVKSSRNSTQDASLGNAQREYNNNKLIRKVVKRLDKNGSPIITPQEYLKYGITISSAIITDVKPNPSFIKRMKAKQDASAELAVAKANTLKEAAKKLLEVARGERMAAESQAQELKTQIVETTRAETAKSIAITKANQLLDTARIQEQEALINLNRDKTKAKSVKVLADADAYAKRAVIKANGALELKIEAQKYIMDRIATAIEKRKVPSSLVIMGSNGSGGNDLTGQTSEINQLLSLIAAKSAKDLSLNLKTE